MKMKMSRYVTKAENQLSLFISPFFFGASSVRYGSVIVFFCDGCLACQYFSYTIPTSKALFIIPFDDSWQNNNVTLYLLVTDKSIHSIPSIHLSPIVFIQSISVYYLPLFGKTITITFRLNYWLSWIKKGFHTLNATAKRKKTNTKTYGRKRKCKWKQDRHKEIFVWILWKCGARVQLGSDYNSTDMIELFFFSNCWKT